MKSGKIADCHTSELYSHVLVWIVQDIFPKYAMTIEHASDTFNLVKSHKMKVIQR